MAELTIGCRASTYETLARLGAGLSVTAGVLVLIGWITHHRPLTALFLKDPIMPLMAVTLILQGTALILLVKPQGKARRFTALTLALVASSLGLALLIENLFGIAPEIDLLLFKEQLLALGYQYPGRPSTQILIPMILNGLALLLLDSPARKWGVPAEGLVFLGILPPAVAILGYVHDARELYSLSNYYHTPLPSALIRFVLGVCILFARPNRGLMRIFSSSGQGGTLLRRAFFPLVLLPLAIAWSIERAQEATILPPDSAHAFMVLAIALLALLLVWQHAVSAERAEAETAAQMLALKQADRMKDEFLSVISHELRTPLNFITGFASLLDEEVAGRLNQQQHEYVSRILMGSDRLLDLTKNLLDASHMVAGKFEISPSLTLFEPVVREALDRFLPEAEQKQVTMETDIDTPGELLIDGMRIIQVLANLLSNAIKFTPAGGRIVVHSRRHHDALITTVTDTGIGIAAADLERLFRPFGQLDMSTTRCWGGCGLGLALSQAIVHAHGGLMSVRSEAGKGSCFEFTLPIASPEPHDGPRAVSAPPA